MKCTDIEKKLHIKKADIILSGVCLMAALFLMGGLLFGYGRGQLLQVSYDGEVILTAQLEESMYYLITYKENGAVLVKYEEIPDIPTDESYNLMHVAGRKVNMEAADCKDQICVHHKPISGGSESIICLPHRLAAEIVGGKQDERIDGMVK